MPVFLLSETHRFPQPRLATREGLLAIGGDLSVDRLILAYQNGIFPWFSEGEPILWWSPDPRLVLFPSDFKPSKSLQKVIRRSIFDISLDQAFPEVIRECARIRIEHEEGTWIVDEMIEAYCQLHESGLAHSVEAWQAGKLVGGLYGVSLGRCFFGESMFSRVSNASKVAFAKLVDYLNAHAFDLIDCQVTTQHLISLGAREIPRDRFLKLLANSLEAPTLQKRWQF